MIPQSIIYFGDSLTDNGNLYDFGEGILPDDIRDAISGPTQAVSNGRHTRPIPAISSGSTR